MSKTTWARELAKFEDEVEACTLSAAELESEFDGLNNMHQVDARPFTAWSRDWVYFTWEYDGLVGVARAPRNPTDCSTMGPTDFVGERWQNNLYTAIAEDPDSGITYAGQVFEVCDLLARDHFICLDFPDKPYGRFVDEAKALGLKTPVNLRVELLRDMVTDRKRCDRNGMQNGTNEDAMTEGIGRIRGELRRRKETGQD